MNKKKPIQLSPEQLERIEHAGPMRSGVMTRAYNATGSKTNAIKAKCLECVNFENPVETIGECASLRCPLHAYRPYRKK